MSEREPILITIDETSIPESPVPSDDDLSVDDEEDLARFIAALGAIEDIDR